MFSSVNLKHSCIRYKIVKKYMYIESLFQKTIYSQLLFNNSQKCFGKDASTFLIQDLLVHWDFHVQKNLATHFYVYTHRFSQFDVSSINLVHKMAKDCKIKCRLIICIQFPFPELISRLSSKLNLKTAHSFIFQISKNLVQNPMQQIAAYMI